MPDQNFKNHSRMVPAFHYLTFLLITAILAGSVFKLYRSYSTGLTGLLVPAILVLIGIVLLLLALFTRTFALKAQDRAIRAEESLRYFAITGKLPDTRLTIGQFIALRFASNNELVDLAHKAVEQNMSPADIKKAVQHWREDNHRV